jgi:hypothetical protein
MWARGFLAGKTVQRDEEAMQAGKQRTKPSFPEPFLDVITPFRRAIASPNHNVLKRLAEQCRPMNVLGKNFPTRGQPMQFGTAYVSRTNKCMTEIAAAIRNSELTNSISLCGMHHRLRPADCGFDFLPVFKQQIVRGRFEAQHEYGLRVRSADESPSVWEQHARAIDVHHLVRLAEVPRHVFDDFEFQIFGAIDSDFRR